jgi:hypothetical protein
MWKHVHKVLVGASAAAGLGLAVGYQRHQQRRSEIHRQYTKLWIEPSEAELYRRHGSLIETTRAKLKGATDQKRVLDAEIARVTESLCIVQAGLADANAVLQNEKHVLRQAVEDHQVWVSVEAEHQQAAAEEQKRQAQERVEAEIRELRRALQTEEQQIEAAAQHRITALKGKTTTVPMQLLSFAEPPTEAGRDLS